MVKKKFFTLLEVMIALFLTAILLSVIFRFFFQITLCDKKMKTEKEIIIEQHNFQIKLNSIFSQLIYKNQLNNYLSKNHSKEKKISDNHLFYTKENVLFFYFDNGIDKNPYFSSIVSAKLYVDENNDFILKIYQKENPSYYRKEVLAKNINLLYFKFLGHTNTESANNKKKFEESDSWKPSQKEIPAFINIKIIKHDKKELIFDFYFANKQPTIVYF